MKQTTLKKRIRHKKVNIAGLTVIAVSLIFGVSIALFTSSSIRGVLPFLTGKSSAITIKGGPSSNICFIDGQPHSRIALETTLVTPDAGVKDLTWTSSDNSIATVDEFGIVQAVNWGECDITASTPDGKTATKHIYVVKPFEFVINTSLDTANGLNFKLGLFSGTTANPLNASVDWGDGMITTGITVANPTHTYATNGTYTVLVYGDVPYGLTFYTINTNMGKTLTEIKTAYLPNVQTNASNWLNSCTNLTSVTPTLMRYTKSATNMSGFFMGCTSLQAMDVSSWDTSNVTDMTSMFASCGAGSLDLSNWDVSKVTNMSSMFATLPNITSIDTTGWNTKSVTSMAYMFYRGQANSPIPNVIGISGWNTSNVTNLSYMFGAYDIDWCFASNSFMTSLDLSTHTVTNSNGTYIAWDTSKVTDASFMFVGFKKLQTLNITGWRFDTASNINLASIFKSTTALTTITGIEAIKTDNVVNMNSMFCVCGLSGNIYLTGWSTANVTNMGNMFTSCNVITLDLSTNGDKWNVAKVTDMSNMFGLMMNIQEIDTTGWNTKNVTTMMSMFQRFQSKSNIPNVIGISDWNTSSLTNLSDMFGAYDIDWCFAGNAYMTNLDLSTKTVTNANGTYTAWDTSKVTDASYMFLGYIKLQTLNITGWRFDAASNINLTSMLKSTTALTIITGIESVKTDNVVNMNSIFYGCGLSGNIDLSGWNTANTTNMSYMFCSANNITGLNLSSWNTANVNNMSYMFANTTQLTSIDMRIAVFTGVTNYTNMFTSSGIITSPGEIFVQDAVAEAFIAGLTPAPFKITPIL